MTEPKRTTSVAELTERLANFRTPGGEAHGLAYRPQPSDIFVVTPAKCGTTWMQQIVHGLRTRGSMDFDEITRVVPWIEMAVDMGIDIYEPQVANPRAFKTHQVLDNVPKGGKYICIVRDPKDAMLSHYHFFEGWTFERGTIPIADFALGYYANGRKYWQHINAIWTRRNHRDVLALCYENIKKDLPQTIKRVAEFMGINLDAELKEIVIRQSDIKFMREHNSQFDDHIVRETRNRACGFPMDGTTSKVKNGEVGGSKKEVPAEVKVEFDRIWSEEVTPKTGLRSYENLQKGLMIM
jgi:Sulfotransferase domain